MRKLFFVPVMILFVLGVKAQKPALPVEFGVKAGLNFPDAKVKYSGRTINGTGIIGFHFGGFAELNVAEKISFQPELLFSSFGAKTPDGRTKTTLNYINIPLLAKYNYAHFGFYIGPQLGLLASAKLKFEGETRDAKKDIKSFDLSGLLGAEYRLESGLGFSVRYALSMTSIAKNKSYKEHHNIFQIGALYRL